MALVLQQASPKSPELTAELYIDGKKVAEGKTPGIGAHVGDINVGRSGNTRFRERAADQPTAYTEGRLDDFRILNRALTAAEVLVLAKSK